MVIEKRLPNSTRKFIRLEKARIRAQYLDFKKQEELIKELYNKILPARNASHSDAGGGQTKVEDTKEVKQSNAEVKTETKKPKSSPKTKRTKSKKKIHPIK